MNNQNLQIALEQLTQAIQQLHLGSVTWTVQAAAGKELIVNWNDHNDDQIDTTAELADWEEQLENFQF